MKVEIIEAAAEKVSPVAPATVEVSISRGAALAERRLLARSATLNLLGEGLPLVAGLVCMPYVVRGLGPEAFGLLSIAWVLLGYFSMFDLGLGRATIKYVAEHLGRAELHLLDGVVNTSLVLQLMLGALGGMVLAVLTPVLVHRLFKISPQLLPDARLTLLILSAGLPFVLMMNSLRGVLEAAQRFDLINYVKIPANSALFVTPAVLAILRVRLPIIVLLMVLVRVAAMLAYLKFCQYALPCWRFGLSLDSRVLSRLLKFGGWVTTTNLVGPILIYMDRFFIASSLSIAAVGFYTVPADLVNRMLIVPISLAAALFPAFSSMDSLGAHGQIRALYGRSIKYVLLSLGPFLLFVSAFAREILRLWLGITFAAKSGKVLEILALAVLVNALGYLPCVLLQGIGRPDIPARFHLLELPLYAVLLWFLVPRLGLTGAAIAWALRVILDAGFLFGATSWLRLSSFRSLKDAGLLRGLLGLLSLALALFLAGIFSFNPAWKFAYSGSLALAFGVALWTYFFDHRDRELVMATANRLFLHR